MDDALDGSFFLQMRDRPPCQASVDLEPFDENGDRYEAERRDFFHYSIVDGLVKVDSVLGFILDLSFRPFLLLSGLATRFRRCGFLFRHDRVRLKG